MSYNLESHLGCVYYRCLEDSNNAIAIANIHGEILHVNSAWEGLYGYSAQEVLGRNSRLLQSGRQDSSFYEKMWASISEPSVGYWKGEVINRSKDGRMISVLLIITPYRSSTGKIMGYMGITTDISEQKKIEEKLRAQESLAAVKHFAERLAHEVGTTLAVIRGRAEMLKSSVGKENVAKGSALIVTQTDHISHLINYLLEFCRGANEMERQPIQLSRLFEKLRGTHQLRIEKHGIEFRMPDNMNLKFLADRRRLRFVLNTLLENALDAVERAILNGRSHGHAISIHANATGSSVIISVEDTGCGIPERNLYNIFQPFFTTKGTGEGTGIGLTLASRLAEDMGGTISVKSNDRDGSRFSIDLPLLQDRKACG